MIKRGEHGVKEGNVGARQLQVDGKRKWRDVQQLAHAHVDRSPCHPPSAGPDGVGGLASPG